MRTHPVVPAYILLYSEAGNRNPADRQWADIESFRYRRLWPEPETAWQTVTPFEWCQMLVQLREWSARKVDQQIDASRADNPQNEADLNQAWLDAYNGIDAKSQSA